MPTVIGHHDVKDKDQWLASLKREELFGPSVSQTSERSSTRRTRPVLQCSWTFPTWRLSLAAMQTEVAAEAMAHDGVLPETLVILVEA